MIAVKVTTKKSFDKVNSEVGFARKDTPSDHSWVQR